MISSVEGSKNSSTTGNSGRRKPLQLLTGIFSRKNRRDFGGLMQDPSEKNPYINEDTDNDLWAASDVSPVIPEPREALHSPYHARTIDQDMENLRLSRQDNPYLQVLASRECLNESDDCSEYEEKHLMAKKHMLGEGCIPEHFIRGSVYTRNPFGIDFFFFFLREENLGGSRDPLTLAEVHARLVRSPPPIMWTRGRNSEPSFSRITSHSSVDGDSDCVFQFPPVTNRLMSPTHSCRSNHSGPAGMTTYKFLAPFDYNSRMRDNTIEAVSGKFNLSPQPRRRPENKARALSDLTS
ncbi:unnamed protein product [Allacma fusca]|uniref:Uncharacterized protein n=1 Tax=Allacma fusca TaxID=39272 RepID=A0A8J2JIC3_9HEXA|nr:unnamed protein product [Allacma fusca]